MSAEQPGVVVRKRSLRDTRAARDRNALLQQAEQVHGKLLEEERRAEDAKVAFERAQDDLSATVRRQARLRRHLERLQQSEREGTLSADSKLDRAEHAYQTADLSRDRAERDWSRLHPEAERAQAASEADADEAWRTAMDRHAREQAVTTQRRRQTERQRRRWQRESALADQALGEKVQATRRVHAGSAASRGGGEEKEEGTSRRPGTRASAVSSASVSFAKSVEAEASEKQAARAAAEQKSLLQLRSSLHKARKEVDSLAAAHREKEARQRAEEEAEKDALLAQGMNPYEEFRRRRRDAQVARETRRAQASVAQARLDVTSTVISEEDERRRQKQLRKEQEKLEGKVGSGAPGQRQATEQAMQRYMARATKDGRTVIDPTGRDLDWQPSDVTQFRTKRFGTGLEARKRPDIVEREAQRPEMRGVRPNLTFVPRTLRRAYAKIERSSEAHSEAAEVRAMGGHDSEEEEEYDDEDGEEEEAAASLPRAAQAASSSLAEEDVAEADDSGEEEESHQHERKLTKGIAGLSVWERRMMQEAVDRQRQNLTRPQKVLGKTFDKAAFRSTPEEIVFRDFSVGKTQSQVITLTNVSLSFASFRLLNLPDEVRDFFEFRFKPPGRMSAGTSVRIQARFLPKREADIHTRLVVLTSTGEYSIPIRCECKKALPELVKTEVDLGRVERGRGGKGSAQLRNRGAIPLRWTLQRVDVEPNEVKRLFDRDDDAGSTGGDDNRSVASGSGNGNRLVESVDSNTPEAVAVLDEALEAPVEGTLDGYSTVALHFAFQPVDVIGSGRWTFSLEFEREDCSPQSLVVLAEAAPLPLYVEPAMVHLSTCVVGKLYRGMLVLRNRSSVAKQASVTVSSAALGCVETVPRSGYVQANGDQHADEDGTLDIALKFRPTQKLLETTKRKAEEAAMTRWEEMRREEADAVRFDESADAKAAEQKDDDDDGEEEEKGSANGDRRGSARESDTPPVPSGPYHVRVPLTITAPDMALPISFWLEADLTEGVVEVKPSRVDFGRCLVGQTIGYAIELWNRSNLPQEVALVHPPEGYSMAESDGLAVLLPGERAMRTLLFTPRSSGTSEKQLTFHTTMGATELIDVHGVGVRPEVGVSCSHIEFPALADGEDADTSIFLQNHHDEEVVFEWIVPDKKESGLEVHPVAGTIPARSQMRVQASVNMTPSVKTSSPVDDDDDKDGTARTDRTWRLSLFAQPRSRVTWPTDRQVSLTARDACVVEAVVTRKPVVLEVQPRQMRFGAVSVGGEASELVFIKNLGHDSVQLVWKALNPTGAFCVLHAPRVLSPGAQMQARVSFSPKSHLKYADVLQVAAAEGGGWQEVRLSGEGVSPTLSLTPDDGCLDFGHVLAGTCSRRNVEIRNTSSFPLSYNIRQVSESEFNLGGEPLFAMTSPHGSLAPGASASLDVLFAPDHGRGPRLCEAAFEVHVPNGEGPPRKIEAWGRAWSTPGFVWCPAAPYTKQSALADGPAWPYSPLDDPCLDVTGPAPELETVHVTFSRVPSEDNREESSTQVQHISVGNASAEELSFHVELPSSSWFSVAPASGKVPAASEVSVELRFEPPRPAAVSDADVVVGRWERLTATATVGSEKTALRLEGFVPSSGQGQSQTLVFLRVLPK